MLYALLSRQTTSSLAMSLLIHKICVATSEFTFYLTHLPTHHYRHTRTLFLALNPRYTTFIPVTNIRQRRPTFCELQRCADG